MDGFEKSARRRNGCDKSTCKNYLFLKRALPSHQMLVNIVQTFQMLAKLTLTILIICYEGHKNSLSPIKEFLLFASCSVTKIQDFCQSLALG